MKENYREKKAVKYRMSHRYTLQSTSKHSLVIIFSIKKGNQ